MTYNSRRRGRGPKRATFVELMGRKLPAPQSLDLRQMRDWVTALSSGIDLGITPEAIPDLIFPFRAQALVTEVVDGGTDYRIVRVGARWQQMHGRDVTNSRLSEYTDNEVRYKTYMMFKNVLMAEEPVFIDTPPAKARRLPRNQTIEMVFFPLRNLQGIVTHFITAVPNNHFQYSGRGSA